MKFGRLVLATFFAVAFAAAPFAAQQAFGQGKAPLIKYKIVDEDSIPVSLTGKPGNPENGKKWAIHGRLGHCIACHVMPVDQPYMGEVGPSLVGVASRYTAARSGMLIVNPEGGERRHDDARLLQADGFHRVRKAFVRKTLSAQQVEISSPIS